MIRVATAVLLTAFTFDPAIAADPIPPTIDGQQYPLVDDAGHDWNGAYLGVFGGYGSGNSTWEGDFGMDVPVAGWLLGGTVGANWQMDSFVLGAEGDVAWSGIGGSEPCPNPSFDCAVDLNWLATFRGRAGLAVDSALFYLTAGLAAGGAEASTGNGVISSNGSATYVGWTAGAGVELAVADNVSVKAEYLYVDLGDHEFAPDEINSLTMTPIGITAHTVKVGVNFAF